MDKLEKILESQKPSKTDPDGWYTGKPEGPDEAPVQDADDL